MTFPRECDGGHMVRDRWREHTQVLPYNPFFGKLYIRYFTTSTNCRKPTCSLRMGYSAAYGWQVEEGNRYDDIDRQQHRAFQPIGLAI